MNSMRPVSAATLRSDGLPLRPVPVAETHAVAGPAALARSCGRLTLSFKRRGTATTLDALFQQGCSRALLPLVEAGDPPCAVVVNTAGGLTGGDKIDLRIGWGEGSTAIVAGQTAERIYRAAGGTARIAVRLDIAAGADAEWLPQETILFDQSRLSRDLAVHVAADARFLGVEALIFGRGTMGESVRAGSLRDALRLYRDGRLVLADVLALDGDMAAALDRPARAAGARAAATLLLVAGDAEARLDPLRGRLAAFGALTAASAWDGILVARMLAPDGAALRRVVAAALAVLRPGRMLPRVWLC
jgi:urease accessory protein